MASPDEARIQMIEEKATAAMNKAVVHLLLDFPLYGALIERLKRRIDWRAKTMWTDARYLAYNPEFVLAQSFPELVFVLAHEVTHCALGHPMRSRGMVHRDCWALAIDHVTNLVLIRDPRLPLHPRATCDKRFERLTAKEVYNILVAEKLARIAKEQEERRTQLSQTPQGMGEGESDEQEDAGNAAGGSADGSSDDDESSGAQGHAESGEDDAGDVSGGSGEVLDEGASADADDLAQPPTDGAGGADGEPGDPQTSESDSPADGGGVDDAAEDESLGEGSALGDVLAPGEGGEFDDEESDSPYAGGRTADDLAEEESEDAAQREAAGEPTYDEASDAALQREWEQAVAVAALAQADESAETFARMAQQLSAPRQSFEEVLERFMLSKVRTTEDWGRPNRRFADVYMPSLGGMGAPVLIFGIDTSASISDAALGQMLSVVERVYEQAALRKSIVVFCDSSIRAIEEYEDQPPRFDMPRGGGGTRFYPVFEYAKECAAAGEEVVGVIYLTDQIGRFPEDQVAEVSDIPTLWVNPGAAIEPPFGEVVSMLS